MPSTRRIHCSASAPLWCPGGDKIGRVHTITVPKIRGYFSGVGDPFSALVLAHFDPTESGESALSIATARAVNTTHAVPPNTLYHYTKILEDDRPDTNVEKDKQDVARLPKRMKARELKDQRCLFSNAMRRGHNLERKLSSYPIYGRWTDPDTFKLGLMTPP